MPFRRLGASREIPRLRDGSFECIRVRYQSVIALPQAVRQLTTLQFDFHAFVYGLNHFLSLLVSDKVVDLS